MADFSEALRLNPRFAEAHANRGAARVEMEDFTGALADYNAALALDPRQKDLYARRAAVRCSLGDGGGARVDSRQAVAADSLSAEAHANVGAALHLEKDFPAAIAAYSRALELNPGLCWVHIQRGNAYHHSQN